MASTETDESQLYHGSCHCGKLKFTAPKKDEVPSKVSECNCSYCRRVSIASTLLISRSLANELSQTGIQFTRGIVDGDVEPTSEWSSVTDYVPGSNKIAHQVHKQDTNIGMYMRLTRCSSARFVVVQ